MKKHYKKYMAVSCAIVLSCSQVSYGNTMDTTKLEESTNIEITPISTSTTTEDKDADDDENDEEKEADSESTNIEITPISTSTTTEDKDTDEDDKEEIEKTETTLGDADSVVDSEDDDSEDDASNKDDSVVDETIDEEDSEAENSVDKEETDEDKSSIEEELVEMELFYKGETHQYSAKPVKIFINETELIPVDMPAILIEDRMMLPMRLILEALGGEVIWKEETQEIFVEAGELNLVFQVNSDVAYQNDTPFQLDVPALIVNDRTMLPVRGVANGMNLDIIWEDETRSVFIKADLPEDSEDTDSKDDTDVEEELEDTDSKDDTDVEEELDDTDSKEDTDVEEESNEDDTDSEEDEELENENTTPETPEEEKDYSNGLTFPEEYADIETISLNMITVPSGLYAQQQFIIQMSESITYYEEVPIDDTKIVLDIYFSHNNLQTASITETNSPHISEIRIGEHVTEEGVYKTRIVFDLTDAKKPYSISHSADLKEILLAFDGTVVDIITSEVYNGKEIIKIHGQNDLNAQVVQENQNIIIDIANVNLQTQTYFDTSHLSLIQNVVTEMVTQTQLRMTLTLDPKSSFSWHEENGFFVLYVEPSTTSYNPTTNLFTIHGIDDMGINVEDIILNEYHPLGYSELVFPEDYSHLIGNGFIYVNDQFLENIEVSTATGVTVIRFTQTQYNAYTPIISENQYSLQIQVPRDVYDYVVLIDAGHGGKDPGVVANGYYEKNIALAVTLKIDKYLQDSGVKVYLTRDSDIYPANSWRGQTASAIADLFVSIHVNSAANADGSQNPLPSGTETYYKYSTSDPDVTEKSLLAAKAVQDAMMGVMNLTNRGEKANSTYTVFTNSTIPSILAEICFLSNASDARLIGQDSVQEKVAKAMAEAIQTVIMSEGFVEK